MILACTVEYTITRLSGRVIVLLGVDSLLSESVKEHRLASFFHGLMIEMRESLLELCSMVMPLAWSIGTGVKLSLPE